MGDEIMLGKTPNLLPTHHELFHRTQLEDYVASRRCLHLRCAHFMMNIETVALMNGRRYDDVIANPSVHIASL